MNHMTDEILTTNSIPILANMTDESVDAVITDPPYPNGQGLFTDQLIDGIAGLYLAAKKARKYVVFFWTPNTDAPRPPPGWWRVATHVWFKPDAKSITPYEHIHVWARSFRRERSRVWTIPILDYRTLKDWKPHPTQKPVRLLRNLIELYTSEGDLILDPFAGTGTTGVAAKHLNRRYLLIETNKEYAAFAEQRLNTKEPDTTPTTHTTPEPAPETPERRPAKKR